MRWFAVMLESCGHVDDGDSSVSPLWERTIVIIRAEDEASAELAAAEVARTRETSYPNDRGNTVHWTFERIVEVQELHDAEMCSGSEVWSTMFRRDPMDHAGPT
jgi:hypothetical protein